MNITEIRTKLVNDPVERLRAFCSITIDGDFVIRDLKVIDGPNGPFLAMPSRKLADRCPQCGGKNHLRAKHCNECGARLADNRAPRDAQGRAKLHADVAHPINATCREKIQKLVVDAFKSEIERSGQPGYEPIDYDAMGDEEADLDTTGDDYTVVDNAAAHRGRGPEAGGGQSEYDALIADLKRDAARRKEKAGSPSESRRAEVAEPARPAGPPAGARSAAPGAEPGAGRSRRRRRSRRRDQPDDREATDRNERPATATTAPEPREAEAPPPVPAPVDTHKEKTPPADRSETDPLSDFGVGIL